MRQIIATDPERHVIFLAIAATFGDGLNRASMRSLGDTLPIGMIFVASAVGALIGGPIALYLFGALLRWTGSLLGGKGNAVEVRAAYAWSRVPMICGLLLWIPYLLLYRSDMFMSETPRIDANPLPAAILLLADLVLGVWFVFAFLKCLGEAHQFSAWRALGATILAGLVIAAIAIPIVIGIGFLLA